jgi:DGQHR domain-containing protein
MAFIYSYIEFDQPAGTFLFSVVPAIDILQYFEIDRRAYTEDRPEGTQREDSKKRVKEIADYVVTSDATFPTSVILSLRNVVDEENPNLNKINYIIDREAKTIEIVGKAEVVDGQHRLEGLQMAEKLYGAEWVKKFTLPCVFIMDPIDEEKAFIFATINGKQNKVNASLVYDLFGTSSTPDPYHILHKLARTLNFKEGSPFKDRLKMLGKKSDDKVTESLTQGTFVQTLIPLISGNPSVDRRLMKEDKWDEMPLEEKRVLRDYMLKKRSDLLLPLFENIFNAVKSTWPLEWENHNKFILSKTTGYIGIIKGINDVLIYGRQKGILTTKYFAHFFQLVKIEMEKDNVTLVKEDFAPGGVGENKIRDYLKTAYRENYPIDEVTLQNLKVE